MENLRKISAQPIIALFLTLILIPLNYIETRFFYASLPLKGLETIIVAALFVILFSLRKPKNEAKSSSGPLNRLETPAILLFAVFSTYKIIYFYTSNITRIFPITALVFALVFFAIFFILFLFYKTVFEDDNKAVILSLIGILVLNLPLNEPNMAISYISAAVCAQILILTLFDTKKIISFLKPFATVMLILCALNGLFTIVSPFFQKIAWSTSEDELKIAKSPKRDIYIILLDAYAGKNSTKALNYDNSAFMNKLKNKGFKVYENIESNYHRTVLSIPCFLNADYNENMTFSTPAEAASNARIFKLAKQAGYRTFYLNSWPVDFTIKEGVIDEVYNSSHNINAGIVDLFVGRTLLAPTVNTIIAGDSARFQKILNHADDIITQNGPKRLVFAHFLMPHHPYIYNKNGQENPISEYSDIPCHGSDAFKLNRDRYLEFLEYANGKTLDIIDKIFAQNREKPIIIVMGDHGPRLMEYVDNTTKYEDEFKNYYKYYFNTFLAYYNPEMADEYYDSPKSLVNFSRSFFNEIFGTDLKRTVNRHFFITSSLKTFGEVRKIEAEY